VIGPGRTATRQRGSFARHRRPSKTPAKSFRLAGGFCCPECVVIELFCALTCGIGHSPALPYIHLRTRTARGRASQHAEPQTRYSQVLINALTGKVGSSTHFSGNPTNQAVALTHCELLSQCRALVSNANRDETVCSPKMLLTDATSTFATGRNRCPSGILSCVQMLTFSDPATPDGLNPLNRSQKLSASSNIAMGESNHQRFTNLAKSGKM
jgi:hypothetical protein